MIPCFQKKVKGENGFPGKLVKPFSEAEKQKDDLVKIFLDKRRNGSIMQKKAKTETK